jgi:hypothetical protein
VTYKLQRSRVKRNPEKAHQITQNEMGKPNHAREKNNKNKKAQSVLGSC